MENKLTTDERKRWARTLYVQEGKGIKEVALEVNTDEATIRLWIQAGDWELVRTSLCISKKAQLQRLYNIVEQLTENSEGLSPKELDLIIKYTAAIKNLDTENSVFAIVDAAELFMEWLYRRNKSLTQTFAREFDLFVKERKAA